MIYLMLFLIFYSNALFSLVSIKTKPLCTVYTKNSILDKKATYKPYVIGTRKRWATCTGAAWFHSNYLVVANLYGEKITSYKFDEKRIQFEQIQELNNSHGLQLTSPENLTVSPDGSLLAVCLAAPHPGIRIYSIDQGTHMINPIPIFKLNLKKLVHNIRFTPDGSHVAITQWNNNESVAIYKILQEHSGINLQLVDKKINTASRLVAKGINFTKDGNYAAIVYSKNAGKITHSLLGVVALYTFNPKTGLLGEQLCSVKGSFCCEDIIFIDNDTAIVCSDQNNDALIVFSCNPAAGLIDSNYTTIKDSKTQLDFPHGMALNADGNYLVVTNYGDDKFSLYKVT